MWNFPLRPKKSVFQKAFFLMDQQGRLVAVGVMTRPEPRRAFDQAVCLDCLSISTHATGQVFLCVTCATFVRAFSGYPSWAQFGVKPMGTHQPAWVPICPNTYSNRHSIPVGMCSQHPRTTSTEPTNQRKETPLLWGPLPTK